MSDSNRRIDRVLAADYLEGLAALSMDEVRSLRKEAEQEETDLSYIRRLLQGRLDILRAERDRRSGSGDASLVDSLAKILADDNAGSPHGLGRHIAAEPSRTDQHRRAVEALVADLDISDPGALDDAALGRALEVLETEERSVSEKRRAVQKVMDASTAEITRRYRDGDANVSDLLPTDATS
jgi:hypothetical protein